MASEQRFCSREAVTGESVSVHSISFGRPKLLIKKLEEVNKLVSDKLKTATFLNKGSVAMF